MGEKMIAGLTPPDEVRKNYKINKFNRWMNSNEKFVHTAQRRYAKDFFECASNIGKNKVFSRNASVYTMGSCFARNIERALRGANINVLSDRLNIDPGIYTANRDPSAAMNKFNIPSMKNEFLRAFGMMEVNDDPFIALDNDLYFDTSTAGLNLLPLETLRDVQGKIVDYAKLIEDADLFIITLGLVEMFVDNYTGCVLNTSPHPLTMRKYPDRFYHYRPGYEYLKKELDELLDLLAEKNKNLEIVVTVSPVPLQSTMTNEDVVVSNTYSKSLLRVLANSAVTERENVSYFPSYEMVMNSPRALTWQEDCIHVESAIVEQITKKFITDWFE